MTTDDIQIIRNEEMNRFEAWLGDDFAWVDYKLKDDKIYYTHTEVPAVFAGQGVGKKLAYAAMEYAKDAGYAVFALCPFIKGYVGKHPEYQSFTKGWDEAN